MQNPAETQHWRGFALICTKVHAKTRLFCVFGVGYVFPFSFFKKKEKKNNCISINVPCTKNAVTRTATGFELERLLWQCCIKGTDWSAKPVKSITCSKNRFFGGFG